jgi:transcriptional regulator with XRE-family HTH domain
MPKVTVNSIGEYIREQREQAKISMRQLAQTAGVSNPYLSQIERGLRKPSADILQQIAKGLRISAEALYVQAGILEDRPADSGVRSALLTDPELSERQKQVLIEIYESFRRENIAASESAQAEAVALAASDPGLGDADLDDGAPGAEAFLAQQAMEAMETAEMATGSASETGTQAPAAPIPAAPIPDASAAVAYTAESEATDIGSGSEPGDVRDEPGNVQDQPGVSSQAVPPIRPDSASD